MKSKTDNASNRSLPFDFVERFRDSVFQASIQNIPEFFHLLARVTAQALCAKHVDILDNNVYGKCLVHLASFPEVKLEQRERYQTLSRRDSLTGLAIERCDIVVIPDLNQTYSGRRFNHPELAENLKLNRLVSIPIFNVFNSQLVTCVVNLYYGPEDIGPFDPTNPGQLTRTSLQSLDWLSWSLGTAIHYLLLRVDRDIRARTEQADTQLRLATPTLVAGQADTDVRQLKEGLPSTRRLFRDVLPAIKDRTRADEVSLFLWEKNEGEKLVLEESNTEQRGMTITDKGSTRPLTISDRHLLSIARNPSPGITTLQPDEEQVQHKSPRLAFMAVPILTKSGELIGVIRCSNSKVQTFSSFEIFSLETFARELSPYLERLLRLREDSMFAAVIKQVFEVITGDYDHDQMLQETIKTIVNVLCAETGSIYLMEGDHLVMRAGATISEKLIGEAKYEVSDQRTEGITGRIAKLRKVIRFNDIESNVDLEALGWIGKYNDSLWPGSSRHAAESFLGVPILRGDELLGVWKVENIQRTDQHPDPFFTHEDGQMALIISSFLAYVIKNRGDRRRTTLQLRTLARQILRLTDSTIKIEEKHTESEAAQAVLEELKNAGWDHAMVSLYDPQKHLIVGLASSWPDGDLLVESTKRDANGPDVLALVLRENEPKFIEDSTKSELCDKESAELAGIKAQFVVPLIVDTEKIGTLQIGLGNRTGISSDDSHILIAFAKHLAIAISRIRNIKRVVEMSEQVMASARFVAAEEIAALAVHSLKHRLNDTLRTIDDELKIPAKRQNGVILEHMEKWQKQFKKERDAIEEVLNLVKGGKNDVKKPIDLHIEIHKTISIWINFLQANNCVIQHRLLAKPVATTYISARSFGEILAVLLVNSAQAFSRQIEIRTSNSDKVVLPNDVVPNAICVDVIDDGIGLGGSDPEEIFQPTFTTKPDKQGTGLGLFMARQLARSAGGDLIVAPTHSKTKGVTFRLILPLDM